MAAVTVTQVRRLGQIPHIRGRAVLCRITHNTSYATGGDSLPLANLAGLNNVVAVFAVSGLSGTKFKGKNINTATIGAGVKLAGTRTAPLLQLFVGSATPTEVANATNMSTTTYDLVVVGL